MDGPVYAHAVLDSKVFASTNLDTKLIEGTSWFDMLEAVVAASSTSPAQIPFSRERAKKDCLVVLLLVGRRQLSAGT
jgi:hypothetical protein